MTRTITSRGALVALAAVAALVAAYTLGTSRGPATGALALASPPATSDTVALAADSAATGITVSATGTASGTPDSLVLEMGVQTTGSTVDRALADANAAADKVQKALLARGVAEKDLQTTGLSIQPRYDNNGRTVTGYEVSQSVRAVLRGLDKAGATIGTAVEAGGNAARVNSIGLDISDSAPLVVKARDDAFAKAKAKAEQYAKAAGVQLGRVVSISEQTSQSPQPVFYAAAARAADGASVPIQAGSQDVGVRVTVAFSLG